MADDGATAGVSGMLPIPSAGPRGLPIRAGARRHVWPNGVRCVAAFTVDFDGTGNEKGRGIAPVGVHSAGGYSARAGIPRVLSIFERHAIPATFFVPGYDAETTPEMVRTIVAGGHEVAAHGYVHEGFDLPPDEEERRLVHSHKVLSDLTGTAPLGWRSPGGKKSSITLPVLRDLGYLYDSSDKDYDQPYPAVVEGQPTTGMIEFPNATWSLDDAPFYVPGGATPLEMLELWKGEFETIYNGSGFFMLTFHPRAGFGSGIPSRARVIERLIAYIRTFPEVEFVRLGDLARWCLDPAHGHLHTDNAHVADGWIGGRV